MNEYIVQIQVHAYCSHDIVSLFTPDNATGVKKDKSGHQ